MIHFIFIFFLFVNLSFAARIDQVDAANRQNALTDNPLMKVEAPKEERVPEIASGEESDLGPQYIVKKKFVRKWISAFVDSYYSYTSNVFQEEELIPNQAYDSSLMISTVQFAIAPDAFEMDEHLKVAPKIGFRHQWFNYALGDNDPINRFGGSGGLNSLDFDVQTIFAENRWIYDQVWVANIGFDWVRLLGHEQPTDNYAEFYKEYDTHFGLDRYFPINDQSYFSVGVEEKWRLTDVDPALPKRQINDRIDQSFSLNYVYEVLTGFSVSPFYRFTHSHYIVNSDRNDFSHSTGLGLSYSVVDWATVRLTGSWDIRESDDVAIEDYKKFDLGGGLTLNLRF